MSSSISNQQGSIIESSPESICVLEKSIQTYPNTSKAFTERNFLKISHEAKAFDIHFAPFFKAALDNQAPLCELTRIAVEVNSFPLFRLVCRFAKKHPKDFFLSEERSQDHDPSLTKITNLFEVAVQNFSMDFISQSIRMFGEMAESSRGAIEKEKIIDQFLSQKIGEDFLPIWAAMNNHLKLIEEMLAMPGMTVQKFMVKDEDGKDPIDHAITDGNLDLIQILFNFLDNESQFSIREIRSLAKKAIEEGKLEIVQFFVEMSSPKLDVLIAGFREEESLISIAIKKEKEAILNYLINLPKVSLKVLMKPNHKGETLAFYAASKGKINILSLLKNYPEMTLDCWLKPTGDPSYNLAHIAAKNRQVEVLSFLAQLPGMTFSLLMLSTTHSNMTPVHFAAQNGHHEVINYFINDLKLPLEFLMKCKINDGKTAAFLATERNHPKVIECLAKVVSPESMMTADYEGNTPFHIASKMGYMDVFYLLGELSKMNPSLLMKPNNLGQTPLHLSLEAVFYFELFDLFQYLVSLKGMTKELLFAADNEGKTLAHYAVSKRRKKAMNLLLLHPEISISMFTQPDREGKTALDTAIDSEFFEIFKLIHALPEDQRLFFAGQIIISYKKRAQEANDPSEKEQIARSFIKLKIGNETLPKWIVRKKYSNLFKEMIAIPGMNYKWFMKEDEKGRNLLVYAIFKSSLEITHSLLNFIDSNCNPHLPMEHILAYAKIASKKDEIGFLKLFLNLPCVQENLEALFAANTDGSGLVHFLALRGEERVLHFLATLPRVTPKMLMALNTLGETPVLSVLKTKTAKELKIISSIPNMTAEVLMTPGHNGETPAFGKDWNNFETFQCLTTLPGISLQLLMTPNKLGETPIHNALEHGRMDIIRFFLNHPEMTLELFMTPNNRGETPIHSAVKWRRMDAIKLLLNHPKMTPELFMTPDTDGKTPMHTAAMVGANEIIEFLATIQGMSAELFMKKSNSSMMLPTHIAVQEGHFKTLVFLSIFPGITSQMLTDRDSNGCTIAHYATSKNSVEILKFLKTLPVTDSRAWLQANNKGSTPLHEAIKRGNLEAFKLLTELPCIISKDFYIKDHNQKSILDYAKRFPKNSEFWDILSKSLAVPKESL